jgi:thioredoxin reductase (NADPH)
MAERDLESIAYPKLDDAQLARLDGCANPQLQRHPAGSVLFDVGAREFAFYVVKAGEIEIQDPSVEPPRTVVVHGPGEFTGDVSHRLHRLSGLARGAARRAQPVPRAV